jgi:hypothetical protein
VLPVQRHGSAHDRVALHSAIRSGAGRARQRRHQHGDATSAGGMSYWAASFTTS